MNDSLVGQCVRRAAAPVGLAAGLVLSAAPCAAAGPAAHHQLSLGYEAYIGGISALAVGVQAGLDPRLYDIDFTFGTRGIVSWIVSWTMSAYSHGAFEDGHLVPASAGANSTWSGDTRTTHLAYRPDGTIAVHIAPRPDADDRKPVPDGLRRGTVDLSSALLSALRRTGRDGHCAGREHVFDGQRRYDLVFEDGGKGRIEKSSDSLYHGPTTVCRLSIKPVAGFQDTGSQMDWATGEEAQIQVARIFPDGPPLPVAVEYQTSLGVLRAYLTQARLTTGGGAERLATVPGNGSNDDGGRAAKGAGEPLPSDAETAPNERE